MEFAPICLFVYNRPEITRETLVALQKNRASEKCDLFIFSDGPKTKKDYDAVIKVREIIKRVKGFKTVNIYQSENNLGLADSVVEGVSQILVSYPKIIVLEDDLLTTPNFIIFMNEALDYYETQNRVKSINGYSLKIETDQDVYFQSRPFPWGWATWENRWNRVSFESDYIKSHLTSQEGVLKQFDDLCGQDMSSMLMDSLYNKNNSWFARWAFAHFVENGFSVYPRLSKVTNIGFLESATHCFGINTYVSETDSGVNKKFNFIDFKLPNKKECNSFLRFFTKTYKIFYRIKLLSSNNGRLALLKETRHRLSMFKF